MEIFSCCFMPMEMLAVTVGSVVWMIRTKKIIKRLGALKFVILTIVWGAFLFGNIILMIYVGAKFESYGLVWHFQVGSVRIKKIIEIINTVILGAYWGLTWYGFPAYAILVTVGEGVCFIRKKMLLLKKIQIKDRNT